VFELRDEPQILNAITDYKPDLLHFYCHGSSQGDAQLSIYAAFDIENKQRPSISIEASKLWQYANPAHLPWLLTLNCCESAAPQSSDTLNVASSLAKKGFPSVIGMRRRVASDYANHFTRFLYHSIFDELYNASSQDNAALEWAGVLWKARQEVATKFAGGAGPGMTYSQVAAFCNEWTVPVLYTMHEPLKLKKLAKADERVKAKRQTLVRIRASLLDQGDPDSLKIADELRERTDAIDKELQSGPNN
jgi:hypothetical protein